MIEDTDDADVVAEVLASFNAYNTALDAGDAQGLNDFFWNSPSTVRFGPAEALFGIESIAAFRLGTWKAPGISRELVRVAVTALGRDVATTNALFRSGTGKISRQSQTWARFPQGWKIAAAHVSLAPESASEGASP
jgi:hypothetical protein